MPAGMQYVVWETLKNMINEQLGTLPVQDNIIPMLGSRQVWAKTTGSRRNEWKITAELWTRSPRTMRYMNWIIGLTKAIHDDDNENASHNSNSELEDENIQERSSITIKFPRGLPVYN